MKRIAALTSVTVFVVVSTACTATDANEGGNGGSTTVAGSDEGVWSAPEPPDEFASGLTIGFIPVGFTFVWNEGHETAVFHVFQIEDGSEQVSIGRQISPEPYPTPGEQVVRGERQLLLVEDTREIRVLEEVDGDIRLEVVSQTLDSETLLRIAESTTYDHGRDAATPSVGSFCNQAVPILSRDDLGDDPTAMQQQMDDLSTAVEQLPPDQSSELRTQMDALSAELDLALQGQAENGWSNAEIVNTVSSLCGEDALIICTVQP